MALILIVDDDADVRLALRELLETEGHRVLEATDGDQLLPLIMTHWPDLVLLDQMMPKVPGFEALERLRLNPAGKEFPVIMVTAAGSPQDAIRARQLGALEYIGKPWGKGEIEMRVKWVLQTVKRPVREPAERIFVVDDEEHMRLALATALGDCGYEVAPLPSGAEAVEASIQLNPSLIMLDLNMPGMDGIATLQQLRRIPTTMYTPVIIVTGAPTAETVQAARSLNATDFIMKPWQPRDLELRVRRALDSVATARAA
ncbi:MAG: response regulator [Chloroflexi bacterium]|nr:response regulator [Chloroflexota bacterium]